MAEVSRQRVLASIKELLLSGHYSDLVVTCGTDSYNVHKTIVCTRADFFSRAIKFGGKEAIEGKINLPEDEPAMIKLLIQYIYEGEYEPLLPDEKLLTRPTIANTPPYKGGRGRSEVLYTYALPHTCIYFDQNCEAPLVCPHHTCGNNCDYSCQSFICNECLPLLLPPPLETAEQLLTHVKMYVLADKYQVIGLKELVQEKFRRACVNFWNDNTFPIAANYAFSTTLADDKGLRDIISATIFDHKELVQKPEIQALMNEFNGLALGILMKMVNQQLHAKM